MAGKIIGGGRLIDFDADGLSCRVRLWDADGLPVGPVLEKVKFNPQDKELIDLAGRHRLKWSDLSDHDLDTAARQNIHYNSHKPIKIE